MCVKFICSYLILCCFLLGADRIYAESATRKPSTTAESVGFSLQEADKLFPITDPKSETTAADARERDRAEQRADARFYFVAFSALFVASLLIAVFMTRKSSPKAQDVVLILGLNLVVFGTLIAIAIFQYQEQLAAATGILGAIAGYLFGSNQRREPDRRSQSADDSRNEPS